VEAVLHFHTHLFVVKEEENENAEETIKGKLQVKALCYPTK
jgi:hypothetical protein